MICRHGLIAEGDNTTGIDFECPLKLQREHEEKEWEDFFLHKDKIVCDIFENIKKRKGKVA